MNDPDEHDHCEFCWRGHTHRGLLHRRWVPLGLRDMFRRLPRTIRMAAVPGFI